VNSPPEEPRWLKLQLDEVFLIEGRDIGIACVEVG